MNRAIEFRCWDIEKKSFIQNWGLIGNVSYYVDTEQFQTSEKIQPKDVLVEIEERGVCFGHGSYGQVKQVQSYYDVPISKENAWVLQQFTGLMDKNGVKIYEGDIIEYEDLFVNWKEDGGESFTTVVRRFFIKEDRSNFFKREYIGWIKTCSGSEDGKPVDGLLNGGGSKDWSVIGNIFENPELLR